MEEAKTKKMGPQIHLICLPDKILPKIPVKSVEFHDQKIRKFKRSRALRLPLLEPSDCLGQRLLVEVQNDKN